MSKITPVLLAGGSGTRLWPLSRKSYPKQFAKILSDRSLFQDTALRFATANGLEFTQPITLTNASFRFIVAEQLDDCGVDPGPILIEPSVKNTAPAILAAALYAFQNDSDAILLIAPSDHVIPDTKSFHDAIAMGIKELGNKNIVTFGIKPVRAETGYGYLECAKKPGKKSVKIRAFIEKPNAETAKKFFSSDYYLWNAGIFLFRADEILRSFELHAKELVAPVTKAVKNAATDLGFLRLESHAWSKASSISMDYAVMEHAKNIVAIPFSAGWSDLGEWDSVWRELKSAPNHVVVSENTTAIDCNQCLIRAESSQQHVVGLGLDNLVVVAMPDAVLVADKSRAQEVKEAVLELRRKGVAQAETASKDHRPWGWFETLTLGESFRVKRICVHPGASLSLQSHRHRSEHWVVVEGTATVTIDGNISTLIHSESVYVPVGAVHRLENPTTSPLVLIEIQTGSYLSEDDIIRYEDRYARS